MATILVVDDSATMRRHVTAILVRAGHTVVDARDGVEGLERIAGQPLHAAVVDLHMPRLGGLDMIAAVRAGTHQPELPVVMLTAEVGPDSVARGRALGVIHWFVKPFAPEALVEALAAIVR